MERYDKLILVRTLEGRFPFYKKMSFDTRKKLLTLLLFPFALPRLLQSKKRFIMPYLEVAVTERCSLRCRNCANLMQYYDSPQHFPLTDIMRDVEILEKVADEISIIQLLGGEPFVYPEIAEIVKLLAAKDFIKHIQVVTNGTIVPPQAVLDAMKHPKVIVHISDYGGESRMFKELIEALALNGISYLILSYSNWMDYGDMSNKGLTEEVISHSYRICAAAECKTLLKGHLYTCPRSAHMANLSVLPTEADRLKVDGGITIEKLTAFYNKKCVSACGHCEPHDKRKSIPPALQ